MTSNPRKPPEPPQGLYRQAYEHDACGMGAVVSIDGARSYDILDLGNQILLNLQHRGASGSDGITGDGAGILLQIPHRFFEAQSAKGGIDLPAPGTYGVAMLFSPKDQALRKRCHELFCQAVAHYGLVVLGQRDVPGDTSGLGDLARASEPFIYQVFIGAGGQEGQPLERTLYMARKRAERLIAQTLGDEAADFYICSMSSRTICYKGMFLAPQLFGYYPDLASREMESSLALVHQRYSTNTFPNWQLAQPFRMIAHNGEINTLSGNANRMRAREALLRHEKAYADRVPGELSLEFGGEYSYRVDGEGHLWNPETVSLLQHAVRTGDAETYKKYADLINDQSRKLFTLRGLFEFAGGEPIAIDQVEPAGEIVKRFCTGAMSHGSISKETHETMALAMNRLGAMSNTGEGGEDPARYEPGDNGDSLNSAIKQVASARFGVTIEYLSQAKMLQIKMAQGAKPGEGGQLPGYKVTEDIARLRHATPGVTLISPPPHHDIYSIEDLAQLIYDLKCANPEARISVKLVSEVGVGTVAAGVAKGNADEVLISGHDGGTGASPLSSIKHTGGPWELGLAETQQTLVRNGLRDRICLQADGQMKTGRDVVVAALLGAERFGFGTAPLVSLGCCLMRKCHLGTCPVGIAAQDGELRKQFTGKPEHLQSFMMFVAEEVREIMAELGFRKFEDMVGQTDILQRRKAIDHWKTRGLDLSAILYRGDPPSGSSVRQVRSQDDMLASHLDWQILETVGMSIENRQKASLEIPIKNVHRTVGAILSNRIARACGSAGLEDGTIDVTLNGSAGQSFGAFLARGVTFRLVGDSNDYLGKGLSGGRIVVQTPPDAPFPPHENVIVGNVVLYGATAGEVFINGLAGERFAVRNSGAIAVVEGVGDHACEYMTGGTVVVLGTTGRNFAAGMSGGIAYVLDEHQLFDTLCNLDLVDIEPILQPDDVDTLHKLIASHHEWTGSLRAKQILDRWRDILGRFVKVLPIDYRRAIQRMRDREERQTDSTPATEEVFRG